MVELKLDWSQFAAAVGAIQGLLLTGVLLAQRKNPTANRLLAALMAAFTVYLASSVWLGTGMVQSLPHVFGIGYQMPWLFGPLVYLYARAAGNRDWRFQRRTLVHFIPVAVNALVTSPYYFMSGTDKLELMDRMAQGNVPAAMAILDPFKYVSGIGYSLATVLWLRHHRRDVENSYSNTRRVSLNWLLALTLAAGAIWVLATVLRIAPVPAGLRDSHIALAMAVLVYAIGYWGLRQPEIFRYETAEWAVPAELMVSRGRTSPPDDPSPSGRYERSGLGAEEAVRLRGSLVTLMERDQPWKESELTLADLARRLGSTPHKLSEVLNSEMGQTFHDFVNSYRVRDVQRRIRAGEARARKMLALAMDAGFASKSTFNQAFRKHTSQTPSQFRRAAGE